MKKFLPILICFALTFALTSVGAVSAQAAEVEIEVENEPFDEFEGIWQIITQPNIFISFTDDLLNAIVGIVINVDTLEFGFIVGGLTGNSASFTQLNSASQFDVTITGSSKKRGTLTVNTCTPLAGSTGIGCDIFKTGSVLEFQKIF